MKKHHPTKEEFLKIEYEIGEYKEQLPAEVTTEIDEVFDMLRPYVTLELPLQEELQPAIYGLMYKQYPELNDYRQQWQLEWVNEIASNNANAIAFDISMLYIHVSTGQELTAFENVERMLHNFVHPQKPDLSSMDDYKDWVLTAEQRLEMAASIKESNEWAIALYEETNRLKAEYVNLVQPIILKYFSSAIDEMNTDLWNHFAINIEIAYNTYFDLCTALLYHLETKNLTVWPGMRFIDYRLKSISAE